MPGYSESLSVINPTPGNGDSLVRGYNLYSRDCAMCHGSDLTGPNSVRPGPMKMRDLTLAANYRYGSTDQAMYRTIRFGLPRTAMGSFDAYRDSQVWDLVNFLKSRWRADPSAPPKTNLPGMTPTPGVPPSNPHFH